jgi:hypothetical protein
MKTFSHLWQYLAEFFLEWETFQIKVVEKIKIHILCSVTFFRISCRLWDNVEKCGRAVESTNDNTIWRMRVAFCVTKATRWHSHADAHAPVHTHARVRSHRQIYNIYYSSTATMIRKRASLLLLHTLPVLLRNVYVNYRVHSNTPEPAESSAHPHYRSLNFHLILYFHLCLNLCMG